MFLPQQNPVDSTLPGSFTTENVDAWPLEIAELLDGLFQPGIAPLQGLGMNLWTALSAIVVVWTGLRIAFAGAAFRPWELVTLIMGLSIPLGMLQFYAAPVPGVGIPFPLIVPAGADQIAAAFQGDMTTELTMAEQRMWDGFRQNIDAAANPQNMPNIFRVGAVLLAVFQNAVAWLSTFTVGVVFYIAFLAVGAICLAQVIWAQVALSILVYLGPALIPWLVFKPMAFLFWGWFKAIWTYSFYSIIASAILRVFLAIAISLIESMNAAMGAGLDPTAGPEFGNYMMAVIPLLAATFLAALKVPELSAAIVGGGSGGGIAGMAAMAMAGKGKMPKMPAGGAK